LRFNHKNPKFNDDFAKWLKLAYGKHRRVKIYQGKVHDYLGTKFDFLASDKLSVDMLSYAKEMLEFFQSHRRK